MLTARQAAAALGVSAQTIINWCQSGKLRGERIPAPNAPGFYWVIPESEIQRVKREGK